MRLAVLSDTLFPTLPDGGHGLGRSAHDIATGLARRGHDVTLYAGYGSEFDCGPLVEDVHELGRANKLTYHGMMFDAILDTSHHHDLSRLEPSWPVVNRICDRQCDWKPHNAVVNSPFMRGHYGGVLVNTGIDTSEIPFPDPSDFSYFVFVGKREDRKGWDTAQQVARETGVELKVVNGLTGPEKWELWGGAMAMLAPSLDDYAPRAPLESAALGVPVLCFDKDGTEYHVNHALSGFVCDEEETMAAIAADIAAGTTLINAPEARQWVEVEHSYAAMIEAYESLLAAVANGERW